MTSIKSLSSESRHGCEECVHFGTESEGDYGQWGSWPVCYEKPAFQNLRSFPFKKQMPCFVLSFWHSEFADMLDGTDGSDDRATALWRAKYLGEVKSERE